MNRKLNFITDMLLTAAFAAVFASCGKDEPESRAIEVQDDAALTQNVFADDTQGRGGVTFTTTGAWTSTITEKPSSAKATGPQPKPSATGDPVTWIFISPDHGDEAGDYTIAITLTPNMTGADRTAVITISCEGTEIIITVTQKAETENGATVQVIDAGTVGGCAWMLTGIPPSNYTLAISGNGTIPNAYSSHNQPWYQYVRNIKTIVIQDGVLVISNGAFDSYPNLTSVIIGSSVRTIGSGAFVYCSSLTSVNIGNSVTMIDKRAFYGCSSLTSVSIPNLVLTIGEYAFSGCSGLTSASIGISVRTIGSSAFSGCSSLTSVNIPNSVTTIGSGAFRYCSSLTSVNIPNSVTTIDSYTFSECSGLTSVNIGNSVTTIGSSAFEKCSGLTDIRVDAANARYSSENGVLFNKDKTTLVLYSAGKTGDYVIPNLVTTIGGSAFAFCSSLTSVNIGNSVTTIGNGAFYRCSGLTSVSIPNSVTTIGGSAFSSCSSLTSVTIGSSVTTIGSYTFSECSGLTSVSIGSSVTTIGSGAFSGCSGLTSVTIPNSVITIDGDIYQGNGAFSGCSGLTSVTIGNSVTTIGYWAFSDCSGLTSVVIPNSVTTIGAYAFYGCSGLTSVTNLRATPQNIYYEVFYNVNISACTLKVPASAVNAYKAAPGWMYFGNITAIE